MKDNWNLGLRVFIFLPLCLFFSSMWHDDIYLFFFFFFSYVGDNHGFNAALLVHIPYFHRGSAERSIFSTLGLRI